MKTKISSFKKDKSFAFIIIDYLEFGHMDQGSGY
jgi:hypothetical protein